MRCPICAWSPENQEYLLIYETKRWRVVLAPNQSLIGRCAVHLKRHAGDLADLHPDELLEWLEVVSNLEDGIKTAFGATMFNWSCYMNHAYRSDPPDPHIHWWVVPRYNRSVVFGDWVFNDPDFGDPYDHARWMEVPSHIHQKIATKLSSNIPA